MPAKNVAEFIQLLKAGPDKYSFGSAGSGTSQHISGELFKAMAGVQMQHIPYRGSGQLLSDLLGDNILTAMDNIASAIPHIKAGKLRALAVTTAARSTVVADVPTLAESGLPGSSITFQFKAFFGRLDTFGLGVCNGCQMFAELAEIIPGAESWPRFTTNKSERFEARLSMVEVLESPSLFFKGMAGSRLPIAVAHGEGFANFEPSSGGRGSPSKAIAAMRFTDNHGQPMEAYPFNPNGSAGGLTAVTTADGRFTAMMPHPERVFRNVQMSWTSGDVSAHSAWMQLWRNARGWVG